MKDDKRIEDYLHFYLGCKAIGKRIGLEECEYNVDGDLVDLIQKSKLFHYMKPILRPLSSMSDEELHELQWQIGDGLPFDMERTNEIKMLARHMTPNEFLYLLSKSFDLFGLIDSNLATDSSTIKSTAHE